MLTLKIFESHERSYDRQFETPGVITIGRSADADIVFDDKRISRKHCEIFADQGQWHLKDLGSRNGIQLNGTYVADAVLKNGDVIQIESFKIEVGLPAADSEETGFYGDDEATQFMDVDDADDKTVFFEGGSGDASQDALSKLSMADAGGGGQSKKWLIISLSAVLGICVLAVIFFTLGGGQDGDQLASSAISSEENRIDTIDDLKQKQKIQNYLQTGRQMFEQGRFSEALVRFQAVLEMSPADPTASDYVRRIREEIEREKQKQYLEERKQEKKRDRVQDLIGNVESRSDSQDLGVLQENRARIEEARFLISQNPDLESFSDKLAALSEKNKTAIAAIEKQKADQRQAYIQKLKSAEDGYNAGKRYYDRGDYYRALQKWLKVADMDVECPATRQARQYIPELRGRLENQAKDDYAKALAAYNSKDYKASLVYFQKVIDMYPEYKNARQKREELIDHLAVKAQQLYQEGLVYEGIGKFEKARVKWQQVLETIPVESHEYYKKAREKLGGQ